MIFENRAVNRPVRLVENVVPTAVRATTTIPAMIAYSNALTPRSLRTNAFRYVYILVILYEKVRWLQVTTRFF